MAEKQKYPSANEQIKVFTDKLQDGIKDLYNSGKYKEYLKTMSLFHGYSSRNIMLIKMQMPDATRIASFKQWDEKFNRHVKKGEHSLRIFAPITSKSVVEMEKLDPQTGTPLLDEQGKAIIEKMEVTAPKFKLVPVFDVSQTYGDPLPQLAEDLTGSVAHYEAFLDALKAVSPLPVTFEPLKPGNDGYCRFGEKIGIREGMSEIQTVAAVIHEITHARLHDRNNTAETDKTKSKAQREIEAESVAYVVSQRFNIETAANSFGYLAEWGSRDMSEFKASLETIRKESNSLITAIDDRFQGICKERGIDLAAEKQEQAAASPPPPEKPQKQEPEYTTEVRTENIAGVDFSFEEVIPKPAEKQYELGFGHMGNGLTVWNRLEEKYGDYVTMAHISPEREVTFYDEKMPEAVKNRILETARTCEMNVSAAQNTPVFSVPPQAAPEVTNVTPEELAAYTFAAEYCQCIVDTYPHSHKRSVEEMDNDINGIADLILKGNITGIREGLERSVLNSPAPETARALITRLDGMFPPKTPAQEAAVTVPEVAALLPDPSKSAAERDAYGYTQEDILPLSPERAIELFDADLPVYLLYSDNTEALAFDRDEIITFSSDGLCGITQADWEMSPIYAEQTQAIRNDNTRKEENIMPQDKQQEAKQPEANKSAAPVPAQAPPEMVTPSDVPVYKHPPEIARENGELEAYRMSNKLNNACAAAIDKAICDSNYEPHHYDLKTAVKTVIAEYGAERADWVLANTIQKQHYDGRYSPANQKWAKEFDIPEKASGFFCNAHPVLLNSFIDRKREVMQEKPSLLENLKAGEQKSREQYSGKAAPGKDAPKKDKREEI